METTADAEWNAGDLGCGELVLQLRERMEKLRHGQVLRLVALDPGAPADIPAWCRMTGHLLERHDHPVYLIRRKES
jgi:tRNA 2-thiouridine synthesizing protein A